MNARVAVTPSTEDPLGVSVKLAGYNGQATLHWGDGTPPTHIVPSRSYQHTYPAVGCYMVTALDGAGVLVARQQVVIRGSLDLDGVRVTGDECMIRVRFGDTDPRAGWLPHYRIEWSDGDHEYAWGVPGWSLTHAAMPGRHEVRVVDTTSGRTGDFPVRVPKGPAFDPDFVVRKSPVDESGMTVYCKLTDVADQALHLWWDDVAGPMLVASPIEGMEIPHTYRYPGHYMITVAYAGDPYPSHAKSIAVSIPIYECATGERRELQQGSDRAGEEPASTVAGPARESWFGAGRSALRRGVESVAAHAGLTPTEEPPSGHDSGQRRVSEQGPDRDGVDTITVHSHRQDQG